MTKYKRYAPVDGNKPIWAIIENGKIINYNPNKEELKCLDIEPHKIKRWCDYKMGSICHMCIENNDVTEDSILHPGNAYLKKDKDGKETREYVCFRHYRRDYYKYVEKNDPNSWNNVKKSIANCRTGNQDPNHSSTKGDQDIELACELYDWENLNKTNDNYSTGTPIDCCDNKTGLSYQLRGRRYDHMNRSWSFVDLDDEWHKEYKGMVFICKSRDGNIVERIYRFPSEEIKGRRSIGIYKNPMNSRGTMPIVSWYEEYRVKDPDEIKKANEIWKKILGKRK